MHKRDVSKQKHAVLALVAYPGDFIDLFAAVRMRHAGKLGYDLRIFDADKQEKLLCAAQELSSRDKPVAVLLSQAMKPSGFEGRELAQEVAKKVISSLCVIFSLGASDFQDSEGDSQHQVIHVDRRRIGSETFRGAENRVRQTVVGALDKFFYAR
jgi:hypothetical protein